MDNLIFDSDSYKSSHFLQYPPGTTKVSSYIESRGGKFDKTLFFGPQMFLKKTLNNPITSEMIDEAEEFFPAHGEPFNREGWNHILNKHGGHLPLSILMVPEGTILPTSNVLVQVVNTDDKVPWLTSFFETALLRAVWYPTTVATLSWYIKQDIKASLERTCGDPTGKLAFALNDFGARGVSSCESAEIGGCAHLVNFMGSDNVKAIVAARKYYSEHMAGNSVPAAEHSTITAWGRDGETDAYRNMIKQFSGPGKLFAVVSDSYDIYNAIINIWGGTLKQEVINNGGTLVIRPDSGDPKTVVLKVISLLAEIFGYTLNRKGFKVLPPYIRIIQGDGVNRESIKEILLALEVSGFSTENIVFGMGGALLQQLDRDTLKFAMKASAIQINGAWCDVYKDPITDPGKVSKKGRLALTHTVEYGWKTVPLIECIPTNDQLVETWRNGQLLKTWTFAEIRERSNAA